MQNYKRLTKYLWPVIGLCATVFSLALLYDKFFSHKGQFSHFSWHQLALHLYNLSPWQWFSAGLCSIIAYLSLAAYDGIALRYLRKKIPWLFIFLCSFTSYALSHNIGVSVVSGAAVRYRAYSRYGLNAAQIGAIVLFCSWTFILAILFLLGIILPLHPDLLCVLHNYDMGWLNNILMALPLEKIAFWMGWVFLAIILLYLLGSFSFFNRFFFSSRLRAIYPAPKLVFAQLIIGPLELLSGAGIIYSVLPAGLHTNFAVVLEAFLLSFTIGLLSNAPGGGLGVLEIIFIMLLPDINLIDIVRALIVFRLLYLILPLIFALIFVFIFEVGAYRRRNEEQRSLSKL